MNRHIVAFGLLAVAVSSGVFVKALGAPPNIELLMPFVLCAGLVFGPVSGFFVGCLARFAYDVYMAFVGPWSLYTAPSYGVVGLLAGVLGMRGKKYSRTEMTLIAAMLTIVYDLLTMLGFSLQFGMPLWAAVLGQIPFTMLHLAGNCTFVFLICPRLVSFVRHAGEATTVPVGRLTGGRDDG